MIIEYGYGLDTSGLLTQNKIIKHGAASWAYSTNTGIVYMIFDSIHPLDSSNNLSKIEGTNKVKLNISYLPDYYTARYWAENYIGDPEKNEQI
jgi:hypothetical protein